MLPDIQPGNTKILYFFNCLLDGMHTSASIFVTLVAAVWMFAYALASEPCSEATNIEALFSSRAVFGWIFKLNSAWERFEVEIGSLSSPNYSQLI